jgi:phage terminase small subunit
MALTPKQARFVEEYLIDLNATQAAIRAGYSAKTAYSIGEENLRKPDIAESIAAAATARSERVQVDQAYVLSKLMKVADKCTEDGEAFNPAGANGALNLLGKHLGMFAEKVDMNHGVQDSLRDLMTRIDGKSRGLPGG